MRSWEDYKKTMRSEDDVSALAREGDLPRLAKVLEGRLLKDQGAIDHKDEKGNTPLMLAAYHGHSAVVSHLLQLGADPNTRDRSGNTVLMGAAFKGHVDVLRLLVAAGANVTLETPRGQMALHFAQMFGRAEAAKFLFEAGKAPAPHLQQSSSSFGLRDVLAGWLTFFRNKQSALGTGRSAS